MLVKVKISRQENVDLLGCNLEDVVEFEIEDYVSGVVPSEMNGPAEAMKAQAVAARSIAYKAAIQDGVLSDLSTKTQAFREARRISSSYAAAHQAVKDTAGEVLFYDGKIVSSCPYSASNGGQIVSSQERWGGVRAWLISKPDPYDDGPKNGHAVGMSQEGAKKMASLGFTYKDILDFYYPGTTIYKHVEKEVVKPVSNVKADKVKKWALSKKGCGYAWGATGYVLTQEKLNALISRYPDYVSQAKNGKWLGKEVYDCAQFTRFAMKEAGINMVSGASSQWKKTDWAEQGTIDTLPRDKVAILYKESPSSNPMSHTGMYLGDGTTMDARGSSAGVVFSDLNKYPWTHWGIPVGLYDDNEQEPHEEVLRVLYQAQVTSNSAKLNLRKTPSTSASRLLQIPPRATVDVVEVVNDTWWKVIYNNITGYAMATYLTKVEPPVAEENSQSPEQSPETVPVNKTWYIKVECENENDAKALASALAKLASVAKIVQE